jgi:hypothetical protein
MFINAAAMPSRPGLGWGYGIWCSS